ncbi:MAG: hypothetical protein WC373_14845 [Smithella sp.]|jgi:hypothetical protein
MTEDDKKGKTAEEKTGTRPAWLISSVLLSGLLNLLKGENFI